MTAMEAYNEAFAENPEDVSGPLDETADMVRLIDERIKAAMEPVKKLAIQLVKDMDSINAYLDQTHDWTHDVNRHITALKMMVGATQRNRLLYRHYLSTLP